MIWSRVITGAALPEQFLSYSFSTVFSSNNLVICIMVFGSVFLFSASRKKVWKMLADFHHPANELCIHVVFTGSSMDRSFQIV